MSNKIEINEIASSVDETNGMNWGNNQHLL